MFPLHIHLHHLRDLLDTFERVEREQRLQTEVASDEDVAAAERVLHAITRAADTLFAIIQDITPHERKPKRRLPR